MSEVQAISLDGGVQSSVMVLMAEMGELDTPDLAVHADTHGSQDYVTEFPILVTDKGDIRTAVSNPAGPTAFVPIPAYARGIGKDGMGRRQCTRQYKVEPVEKAIRRFLDVPPRKRLPENHVEQWIGFSIDEITRVKPNETRWITNRYPLIELEMSRRDCVDWWHAHAPSDAPAGGAVARSDFTYCAHVPNTDRRNVDNRPPPRTYTD